MGNACTRTQFERDVDVKPAVTFRASYAGNSTKTCLDTETTSGSHATVVWNSGDMITVFSGDNSYAYQTEEGGQTALFGPVEEGESAEGTSFLALYPFQPDASLSGSNSLTTIVPTEQVALAGQYDPSAMIAVGQASGTANPLSIAFYNACSGLRFTLTSADYSRITLQGNRQEKISGPVTVSAIGSTAPSIHETTESGSTVSLVLSDLEALKTGAYYYLLFRPCVFENGFTMIFYGADGSEKQRCVCSSYVEFKRGVFSSVREADNPSRLPAIRDGISLSEPGTSNCYIVSEPGSYKFRPTRGNEDVLITGIDRVEVLWETDNTSGNQVVGSIIEKNSVKSNGQYIYFNTPASLKNGKAIIAAYHNNTIIWSWHIWVCAGYDPVNSAQSYPGKASSMMDRNLGALSSTPADPLANGLFYQWGRKDPFPGATEAYVLDPKGGKLMTTTSSEPFSVEFSEVVNATVEYATANPNTFLATNKSNGNWLEIPIHTLWASGKTIYDPCPAGWKVPEARNGSHPELEAWNNLTSVNISGNGYGLRLFLSSGATAWYPNNGYISLSGALLMVGQYSCYWSCTQNGQSEFALELSQKGNTFSYDPICYGKVRGEGHSVRCVAE